MASTKAEEHGSQTTQTPKQPAAKLADDFQPNEPVFKSGVDEKGMPNDTLSEKQAERAANEALLSLRPQPTAAECQAVFDKLSERDDKGKLKKQFKTAKEAGDAAVAALNEGKSA